MKNILCSKNKFDDSFKIGEFYLNSSFNKKDNDYFLVIGELFSHSQLELVNIVIKKEYKLLNTIDGEFCLINYNSKKNILTICSDRAGRNITFYTSDGFISTDFWASIKHLNYKLSDVSSQSLKEHIFFNTGLSNNTIIDGLNIVPPATHIKIEDSIMHSDRYWEFKFTKNNLTESEKMDQFDDLLNKSFKLIKQKNSNECKYGIGISGGLDSRIIPYYANKNKMKLNSFIIGKERPNYLFLSNDHYLSNKIAKLFNLKLESFQPDNFNIEDRMNQDVLHNPYGSSQLYKIIDPQKMKFDVLLTGASGYYIGASPNYSKVLKFDILSATYTYLSMMTHKISFNKLLKGMNAVFKTKFNTSPKIINYDIPGILSKDERNQFENSITKFYDNLDKDSNNIEKIMNHTIFFLGQRNKRGGFESFLGYFKSYTPYYPFMLDFVQKLTLDEFVERKFFEKFILLRLPHVANIRGQDYKESITGKKRTNTLSRITSMLLYLIRGSGVMNYKELSKTKRFAKFYTSFIIDNAEIYSKFFRVDSLINIYKEYKFESLVYENILKYGLVLKKIRDGINN